MANFDYISILDGSAKTPAARGLRLATALAEPFYTAAVCGRNVAFNRGLRPAVSLGRPTVSVGNLTTGGTGKTPVVRWLAERLRADDRRPAVLMRGYHAAASGGSDEQRELARVLNRTGDPVPVQADPSRVRGATAVLASHPGVGVFVLDDGFQHRSAARQFDLVLVNAASPFGFGHVLPRGLLREPLAGLSRASAILVTHQGRVARAELDDVIATIRRHTSSPIFRADHVPTGLISPRDAELRPMSSLALGLPLAVAGVGDPAGFAHSLSGHAGRPLPHRWFADHHDYTPNDWAELCAFARSLGCDRIVTTEKDWSKLSGLVTGEMVVEVVQLTIEFAEDDGERLYALIREALGF